MPVTYSLGKDATISGLTSSAIRSVTATVDGSQIDITRRGHTERKYKSGWKEATIEVEMLDSPPSVSSEVTVTHPNSGLGGVFIVTSVATSEPLDDVVTYSVTLKLKQAPSA